MIQWLIAVIDRCFNPTLQGAERDVRRAMRRFRRVQVKNDRRAEALEHAIHRLQVEHDLCITESYRAERKAAWLARGWQP